MSHAADIKLLEDEETLLKSRLKAISKEILTLNDGQLKLIRVGNKSNVISMRDRNFKSSDM